MFPAVIGFAIVSLFCCYWIILRLTCIWGVLNQKDLARLSRTAMLILAVTIHNFPEGMAVGVVVAGVLQGDMGISIAAAMTLSLCIAIQNIPEGAIISMPLKAEGK